MKKKSFVFLAIIFLNGIALANPVRTISSYSPNTSYQYADIEFRVGDPNSFPDALQIYLEKDRSYQCSFVSKTTSGTVGLVFLASSFVGPTGLIIPANANGRDYPAITNRTGIDALSNDQNNNARVSIIPTMTGLYSLSLQKRDAERAIQKGTFNCRETTLYGSFNRFFAQSAILEIRNSSTNNIPVQISIVDGGGNIVVDKQNGLARANTRTDIIFNELPANSYGQIIITHNAPFGALSGYVSEYNVGSNGEIILKRERKLAVTSITNTPTQ